MMRDFWSADATDQGPPPDDITCIKLIFDQPDEPDLIVIGGQTARLIRKALARNEAEDRFAGRDWRRIKREGRKAWERTQ